MSCTHYKSINIYLFSRKVLKYGRPKPKMWNEEYSAPKWLSIILLYYPRTLSAVLLLANGHSWKEKWPPLFKLLNLTGVKMIINENEITQALISIIKLVPAEAINYRDFLVLVFRSLNCFAFQFSFISIFLICCVLDIR